MRIVFLDPSGELGGAETALVELIAALREARPSWALRLIAAAPGPFIDRASRLGIRASPLPFPSSLARLGEWGRRGSLGNRLVLAAAAARAAVPALSYSSRLRRELALVDPDIVHTNGLKMHVLGARSAPARSKVVWHLHDYPDARPMGGALLRKYARRCSAIVANSESVAGRARRMLTSPPVHTVHNAVDLDRFHPEGPSLDLDAASG
ncbi:MAG: glycosyl transferase family 1, partial [Acidobacteria bacterium]